MGKRRKWRTGRPRGTAMPTSTMRKGLSSSQEHSAACSRGFRAGEPMYITIQSKERGGYIGLACRRNSDVFDAPCGCESLERLKEDKFPAFFATENDLEIGDRAEGLFVCFTQGRMLLAKPRATANLS